MYGHLGSFVARHWIVVLLLWVVFGFTAWKISPTWDQVSKDGDLAYLPARMTSIRGQTLYGEAFPDNKSRSEVVVVLERNSGLVLSDLALAQQIVDFFKQERDTNLANEAAGKPRPNDRLAVVDVMSPASNLEGKAQNADDLIGQKLISPDKKAVIVLASLEHELIAVDSARMMGVVEKKIGNLVTQAEQNTVDPVPAGLQWGITGSAAVGGDTLIESDKSIETIHTTTAILVVIILLAVYQAPILVFVPLITIGVSVFIANNLIALLTQLNHVPGFGWFEFEIFKTSKIFIFTVCFGSGTDFCLFLISRYKEELERGLDESRALQVSLGSVGHALTGSAMTTVCGLGMMYFADFGKFTYSGPAIALCLVVTLFGCITFAPAMLRGFGAKVFWPFGVKLKPAGIHEPEHHSLLDRFWIWTSRGILARPGLILLVSLVLMTPLAIEGTRVRVSYDLLSDLQPDRPSKLGTAMMERHFPPGEMGPITMLIAKKGFDFNTDEGRLQITELDKEFWTAFHDDEKAPNRLTAVRCLTWPLGDRPRRLSIRDKLTTSVLANHKQTEAKYLAMTGPWKGEVTRFDIVTAYDPFSINAESLMKPLDQKQLAADKANGITNLIDFVNAKSGDPNSFWHGATFDFIGTTSGTRDLKAVVNSDEVLIQRLVVISVFCVVLFLLRRPLICGYLIFTVVFSYLVTIGATELVFEWMYPDFPGLDWKVPIFLFVILVAVGEDYNIYLATRIFEEERRLGRLEGLRTAIVKTGGIITSCGVIMAGTFISLMSGSLKAMHALGFALTLGVILDTFIVRPILVPAFLAWLYEVMPERIARAAAVPMEEAEGVLAGEAAVTVPAKPHTERAARRAVNH